MLCTRAPASVCEVWGAGCAAAAISVAAAVRAGAADRGDTGTAVPARTKANMAGSMRLCGSRAVECLVEVMVWSLWKQGRLGGVWKT